MACFGVINTYTCCACALVYIELPQVSAVSLLCNACAKRCQWSSKCPQGHRGLVARVAMEDAFGLIVSPVRRDIDI